jgi:hypothetical protein
MNTVIAFCLGIALAEAGISVTRIVSVLFILMKHRGQ